MGPGGWGTSRDPTMGRGPTFRGGQLNPGPAGEPVPAFVPPPSLPGGGGFAFGGAEDQRNVPDAFAAAVAAVAAADGIPPLRTGGRVPAEHTPPPAAEPPMPAASAVVHFKGEVVNTAPPFVVAATSCLVMAHNLSPFSIQQEVMDAVREAADGVLPAACEFQYIPDSPYAIFDMPTRQLAERLIEHLHDKEVGGHKLQLQVVALQSKVDEHAEQAEGGTADDGNSTRTVMYVPVEDARCSALSRGVPSQWAAEVGPHLSTAALEALVRLCCSSFSVLAGDVFAHILALSTAAQAMSVVGAVLTAPSPPLGDVSVRLVVTTLLGLAHAGQLTQSRAQQLLLWCRAALQDTLLVQSSTAHLKRMHLQVGFGQPQCVLRAPPLVRGGQQTAVLEATVLTPSELACLATEIRQGCLMHPHLNPQASSLLGSLLASLEEGGQLPECIAPLQPSVHIAANVSLAHGPQPLLWRPAVPGGGAGGAHAQQRSSSAALLCSEWNTQHDTAASKWVLTGVKQCAEQSNTAVAVRSSAYRATDMLLLRWAKWMLSECAALPPYVMLPSTCIMDIKGGVDWQRPPPSTLSSADPSSWIGAVVSVPESVTSVPRGSVGVLVSVAHASNSTETACEDAEQMESTDDTTQGGSGGGVGGGAAPGAPSMASEGMQASIRLLPRAANIGCLQYLLQCPLSDVLATYRPAHPAAVMLGHTSRLPVRGTEVDESGTRPDAAQVLSLLPFLPALSLQLRLAMLQRGAISHAQFTALSAVGALPSELGRTRDAALEEGAVARTTAFLHGAVRHGVQEHSEAFLAHGMQAVPNAAGVQGLEPSAPPNGADIDVATDSATATTTDGAAAPPADGAAVDDPLADGATAQRVVFSN